MATKDKESSMAVAATIPTTGLYPAIFSVSPGGGVLNVTGNGKSAAVDASLKTHGHTVVLYLKAAPSDGATPAWPKVAQLLHGLGNITYEISVAVPATVTLPQGGPLQLASAAQTKTPDQVLVATGDTLVVTLLGTTSSTPPLWPDVVAELEKLGEIAFGVDITCVG